MEEPTSRGAMKGRRAARLKLLLVAGLFALPLLAALALHYAGWRPASMRNAGDLLAPPLAVDVGALRSRDGGPYRWHASERIFRLALFAPEGCAGDCAERLRLLESVWRAQGRHADRLEVLWFGEPPAGAQPFRKLVPMADAPALRARLPHAAGARALYVIDPRGFLVLAYPPGFDPSGLRKDIARLLK